MIVRHLAVLSFLTLAAAGRADVGDPQIVTDHPWYPGELACSSFDRLARTQATVYRRVTGVDPVSDQDKALAAWLWRNTHYYHGEEGAEDLWGQGFTRGQDLRTREYWTGLFAHGFGLCGTTHSQWVAELDALLGHGRGRGVGVAGHNTFEAYLTGGPYGTGKWVLLDHDLSTVVFDREGQSLLSMAEVARDWKRLTDRSFLPQRQHGWLICGLHPDDRASYQAYNVAEYMAGYAGPPPIVHLRRGETLRRYLQPGLEDGKTFVFWGRNYNTAGVPGPERSVTWVNQPDRMHGSRDGAGYRPGQARYGNAVYVYRPDFDTSDGYREGVIAEDLRQVTFEFYTPYIIGATPPDDSPWGVYKPGCRNGLVLRGAAPCDVSVSVDQGKTWRACGRFRDGMDLTDFVKGHRQYFLRLHTGVFELHRSGLTITTVCQANAAVLPRLSDGGSLVRYWKGGQAVVSAGPNLPQATAHVVDGQFGTPRVTLELPTPRGERALSVYAAAHVNSGNPPNPDVKYQIECSTDGGRTWEPVVKDWQVTRRGDEPKDFWSQSLIWGERPLPEPVSKVRVRFRNDGYKAFARAEAHLTYRAGHDPVKVTFAWTDAAGPQMASAEFRRTGSWRVPTGKNVSTRWVEFEPLIPK